MKSLECQALHHHTHHSVSITVQLGVGNVPSLLEAPVSQCLLYQGRCRAVLKDPPSYPKH
ncbi:uncharacterized protein CCOS01_09417 [Colletotrichum costaricense]|uniref:Uncharacterized protein n=1 Tax=Colletotrichum costaricense TaxID=1209916 RepID=A0AAI9YUH2_9PEZI|nr:uncharacterized protein CCOS01_09417 [Colletotrichum costaricense]KAK1524330.1 hypothetical protein CCOS01_09417 [Colletotrichum costaricense]